MSGTSADGVDVAIVEVEGRGLAMTAKPLSHAYQPFPDSLRKQILEVRQKGEVRLADLAEIGRQVTLAYVPAFRAAIAKANVSADQIEAIAAHGQTLFHGPPNTIQYFDPSLLAYETGCAVVSDFRRADLAAGGQGAPLVPFADWILFRHAYKHRAILNLGGIANLTFLPAGCAVEGVVAFDTGPANCISDFLISRDEPSGPGYDVDGAIASKASGEDHGVVEAMLAAEYFERSPPKSTDGPEMISLFEAAIGRLQSPPPLADQLAIATLVAVGAIGQAIEREQLSLDELVVSGGGVSNVLFMSLLRERVPVKVLAADELGIAASAREAIAFALLAAATLDGEPSNVPSATGASRRVVLGSITPRPF